MQHFCMTLWNKGDAKVFANFSYAKENLQCYFIPNG